MGGYQTVDIEQQDNDVNSDLANVEGFARKEFEKTNGGKLGDLVKVQTQVVAGINYLLTFESETEVVVMKVFDQSWTQTRKVTSVEVMAKKEKNEKK
jgi:hypothetical protein